MGNSQSVELGASSHQSPPDAVSKRQPQKLSKPRVGNHATNRRLSLHTGSSNQSSSQLPEFPDSLSSPTVRRQSLLHSPASVHAPQLSTIASPVLLGSEIENQRQIAPTPPGPTRRFSLFRPKSSQSDRRSSGLPLSEAIPPLPVDRPSRANSMNWESQTNLERGTSHRLETCGDAFPPSRPADNHMANYSWNARPHQQALNYDKSSYTLTRLQSPDAATLHDSETISSPKSPLDTAVPPWSQPFGEDQTRTISRVNSDVSLYAPVRRRSMIQTPGLATREPVAETSTSRRSSMRPGYPPTPVISRSRQGSIDSAAPKILPFAPPPRIIHPEQLENIETPSEGDYKQLGAMLFGSLRITNGTASPTPSMDMDAASDMVTQQTYFAKREVNNNRTLNSQVDHADTSTISTTVDANLDESTRIARSEPIGIESRKAFIYRRSQENERADGELEEYYSAEVLDVREDPNAKPKLPSDPSQNTQTSLARADSGIVATPMSEYSLKPLSKADSGYSSNMSLRSFTSKHHATEDSSSSSEVPKPGSAGSESSTLEGPARVKAAVDAATTESTGILPLRTENDNSSPPSPNAAAAALSQQGHITPSPSPKKMRQKLQSPSFPQNSAETGQLESSAQPVVPNGSTLSIGGGASPHNKRSKLQRLLSGASNKGTLPSVHVTHSVATTVPDVPRDIEAKLNEHSGRFPMTTKRLAFQKQPSKDTLRTIVSVSSQDTSQPASARNSLILPETGRGEAAFETARIQRRLSIQSVTSLISRNGSRRRSAPLERLGYDNGLFGPGDLIHNGFESHITSIDSIRSSVGKSAFDTAFAAMPISDGRTGRDRNGGRSMTMGAQAERQMGPRGPPPRSRSTGGRYARTPSRASPIPELPGMSPDLFLNKPAPPISLQNRSAKSVRKHPSTRRQSMPAEAGGRAAAYRSSHDNTRAALKGSINSYGDSYVSSMRNGHLDQYPELQYLQSPAQTGEDFRWNSCRNSFSSSGKYHQQSQPGRSMSTSPNMRHKQTSEGCRQRSAYDDHDAAVLRAPHPRDSSGSNNPRSSGAYYESRLLQLQNEQWAGEGYDQPNRYIPHGPAVRHPHNRTGVPRSQQPKTPYRVLHSYNSPAYRNTPIWS